MSSALIVYLEVRRHSLKFKKGEGDTSLISPEGLVLARNVGAEYMRGISYEFGVVSRLPRTQQTLAAFSEGAGIEMDKIHEANLFGAPLEEWVRLCTEGESLTAISKVDPSAFARIAEEQMGIYYQYARMVPNGGRALMVGHMPAIPMAVYGLTRGETLVSPLKECEGVLLTFEGTQVVDIEELRLP